MYSKTRVFLFKIYTIQNDTFALNTCNAFGYLNVLQLLRDRQIFDFVGHLAKYNIKNVM